MAADSAERLDRRISASAVIVTYFPDIEHLSGMALQCLEAGLMVVIVDNTSRAERGIGLESLASAAGIILHLNEKNIGLAAGLNLGIAISRERLGINYVLMLDQDSYMTSDGLKKLFQVYLNAERRGMAIGALGPAIVDADCPDKEHGFYSAGAFLPLRSEASGAGTIESATINCSGMISSISNIDLVGGFDENLFIDLLDAEWSFRARGRKLTLLGVPQIKMLHKMGERRIYNQFLSKWPIPYRSPIRHYYYHRNVILMLKYDHVPVGWKFWASINILRTFMLYLVIGEKRRWLHSRAIIIGVLDGFRGLTGAASDQIIERLSR